MFSLTPPATAGGSWTEAVIHNFTEDEGVYPIGGVVAGGDGVLYGTAAQLGPGGYGTVFSLTPPASPGGTWTETTLHGFSGPDGNFPVGLVVGQGSVLYGVTNVGGLGSGVVYSLAPPASPGGSWTYTMIHAFNGRDGAEPTAGMVIGGGGKLYGTTYIRTGETHNGGVVFELTPPGSPGGSWTYRILHSFSGSDGANPYAALVVGGAGVLYGTTSGGGATNNGTVFSLAP